MDLQHKTAKFEIKGEISDDGFFEGYASVFGVVDEGNDVVLKGAFTESLLSRKPKMLWQHDKIILIGTWLEVREDDVGLFVRGQILTDIQAAKEALVLVKAGEIDEMSIGYTVELSEMRGHIRELIKVKLYEISLVTFAMLMVAKITDVKSIETVRDFEKFLCDAGYSRNQAKAITGHGFKASAQWDADQAADEETALIELNQSLMALQETLHV